jgi:hypothetical protein
MALIAAAKVTALPAAVEVKNPGAGKAGGRGAGKTVRENVGEWEWKNHAPKPGEPTEKMFKGRLYIACKFHKNTQWVLKEGHKDGCKLDPSVCHVVEKAGATPPKDNKSPSKKQLQYANALMAAMEIEEEAKSDAKE